MEGTASLGGGERGGGGGGLQLALKAGFLNQGQHAVNALRPELRGLSRGLPIRVHGLTGAPEYNGAEGTLVRWDAAKERWQVRLKRGFIKLLKPENLEELYTWSVHKGYMAPGDILLREKMRIDEALVKCASLPECRGFYFEGGLTEDAVEILFTSKWDLVPEGRTWLSYRKEERTAAPGTDGSSGGPASDGFQAACRSLGGRRARGVEARRQQARREREEARRQVEEEAAKRRADRENAWRREAEALSRPDYGKPTSEFNVGDICEVIKGVVVRRSEDLESSQLRQLPDKSVVGVVEIGSGPSGKRLLIRDRFKREGWVSVSSTTDAKLLEIVQRAEAKDEAAEPQDRVVALEVDMDDAPFYLEFLQAKLLEEGFETFDPRCFRMSDALGRAYDIVSHDLPLDEASYPLSIRYAEPKERAPAELPEKYRGLPRSTLGDMRPDAVKVDLISTTFGGALAERRRLVEEQERNALNALRDGGSAAGALGQRPRPVPALPWEADSIPSSSSMAGAPRLGQLEQRFRHAIADDDLKTVQALTQEVEIVGMMPDVMRQYLLRNWRGPLGYEPFENKGRLYNMRSVDGLLFDPRRSSELPVALWNPESRRAEPVQGQLPDDAFVTINFFDRHFRLMPRGELVDPQAELVVGAYNPESMQIESIPPVPLKWREFMDSRGFRLEPGSSSSTKRPFIQILGPQSETTVGQGREEIRNSVEKGGWRMLKHASEEARSDRELVLSTLRQGAAEGSWQILLYTPPELRGDREVILEASLQDPAALELADEALREDRALVRAAAERHPLAFKYAGEGLRRDRDFVLEIVRLSWRALKYASEEVLGDREVALEAVQQSWQALEYLAEPLRSDRDVIRRAVAQSWRALPLAAPELRGDAEIVLLAARQSPQALRHADAALLRDRAFMLEAVRESGLALRYASEELRGDRAMAVAAVRQNWRALHFVARSLHIDRELVRLAVEQDVEALNWIPMDLSVSHGLVLDSLRHNVLLLRRLPERMRAEREFMLRAVRINGLALQFAAPELQRDFSLAQQAALQNVQALSYASSVLRSDPEFLLPVVQASGGALEFASLELRADPVIVREAVRQDWSLLRHAAATLCADREFMLEAVRTDGLALRFASEALRAERAAVLAAVASRGRALEHAEGALRAEPEVVLEAVRQDWEALEFASESFLSSRPLMLEAVRLNGLALRFASEELQDDPDFVEQAVRCNWRALRFASRELRADRLFLQRIVHLDPLVLTYASDDLRNDSELVMQAMEGAASRPSARGFVATPTGKGAGKGTGKLSLGLVGGGFLAGGGFLGAPLGRGPSFGGPSPPSLPSSSAPAATGDEDGVVAVDGAGSSDGGGGGTSKAKSSAAHGIVDRAASSPNRPGIPRAGTMVEPRVVQADVLQGGGQGRGGAGVLAMANSRIGF